MYPLNSSARDYLLKAARSTIEAYLRSGVRPVPDRPSARELLQKRGVFVTLYLRGRLRGCVGYAWPLTPLYRAVPECAVSAAVEDLRFRPLNLTDLPETEIELSVLSRMDKAAGASDILAGTHGLLVSQGTCRGLLLPKVAVEHGWTSERFLEQTCLKAGLSGQAWRNGATVERFTATVFGEKGKAVNLAEGKGLC